MNHQNRNPAGNNQHRAVVRADNPTLAAALRDYNRKLITDPSIVKELLLAEHGIKMSTSTIKRRRRELGILGARTASKVKSHEVKTQLVLDALEQDPNGKRGYRSTRANIAFQTGVPLTRDFVAETMRLHDPDGFDKREPTSKKIKRFPIISLGPNAEWSGDGHDKLKKIGFPVYGIRDVASGKWLKLVVLPDNRLGNSVAYVYLDLVEELGGMPLQSTTDCGSETTIQYGYTNALRVIFNPELDPNETPAHRFLKSIRNITVERGWLRLRLDIGDNIVLVFLRGVEDGIYNEEIMSHYLLCRFLWSRLIQGQLDEYRLRVNAAKPRKVADKLLPSGVAPDLIYTLPHMYNLKDQLQPVDTEVIREIKASMGGDSILEFVPPEYALDATEVLAGLGVATLTLGNVWAVFSAMLPLMETR